MSKNKKKYIEKKYHDIFVLLDLDWYQYLELQKLKNEEIDESKYK